MDTQLVEKIVHEVKSQGVFDEFRKDSMADVDTKPAYQNLRQRVENTVKKFLSDQKWTPETNKNQLREKLRRHITESGFLDVGVERIVDQVVNPKIGSVFQPRIEEIAYNYLGLPPPPKKYEPPPPPLMHPLPPLPITAPPPLKVETCSLLPNDLEQVSPDSDKATVKSEAGDDKTEVDMDTDGKILEDEDESPPFEPLLTKDEVNKEEFKVKVEMEDSSSGEAFRRGEREFVERIKTEGKEEIHNQDSNNITPENDDKEASHSMDCRISQDSQLSSVSSDTRLSPIAKDDTSQLRSSQSEAVTANISEEAQMPKFNENSSEPSGINGCKEDKDSELHFDIKKDEIKFEGTERKTNMDNNSHESPLVSEVIKCARSAESNSAGNNKNEEFKFASNNNCNMDVRGEDVEGTPNAEESSFGSSIDNSISIPPNKGAKISVDDKEKDVSMEERSPRPITPKPMLPLAATPTTTPTATPTPTPPFNQTPTATPSPISTQKTEKDQHSSRQSSSSSSSKHKKHGKERRRSHDREREKDRHRSSSSKDNKYHSSSGGGKSSSSSKHYSSSSSKYSSSSSHHKSSTEKDKDKEVEKTSSSSHSSSKHSKHSSADKRHHSSSHKDHSSSSSTTSSKRNERKDDHHEAKHKVPRRKSTDSNDDNGDKGPGGGANGKTGSQYNKSGSSSSNRSKSNSTKEVNQSPPTKSKDTQNDQIPIDTTGNEKSNDKPQQKNNVVILNDLLENPHTQFIELDTHGHMVGTPQSVNLQITTPSPIPNHVLEDKSITQSKENNVDAFDKCPDLLYFEDVQTTFLDRFNLLNDTMDLCRRSVNSLRFDSPIDEGIELSSEDDYNRCNSATLNSLSTSLKRKSNINYEECEKTPRKKCISNKNGECPSKTSPTPSDSSVNSKENEEFDKNTDY